MRFVRTLVLALAALAMMLSACDRQTAARPGRTVAPDIILVSIDSLRADHLGCYGYDKPTSPFIDSLAGEGVRFENAVSTTSWTLPAHAALFTGLYDSAHGTFDHGLRLAESYATLAELLHDAGYHTAGFFGGPYLHPMFGMAQGFEVYQSCMTALADDAAAAAVEREALSSRSVSHADVTGPRTLERIRAWTDGFSGRPFFLFIHLWDVHYDYIPPPEYLAVFDPDYAGPVSLTNFIHNDAIHARMSPRDLQHVVAAYNGEIRFTDDILSRIFAELRRRGMLQNALTIVTSDHGDEFFEHGFKGHKRTLHEEVLRVPLIFHWPGELPAGGTVRDQVSLVDIVPTLAGLAGLPAPAVTQGRDIAPLLYGRSMPDAPVFGELLTNGRVFRALRTNDAKVIHDGRTGQAGFYDLVSDPREQFLMPLAGSRQADRLERLMQFVEEAAEIHARFISPGQDRVQVGPEMTERLRTLGYIGDSSDSTPMATQPASTQPARAGG